MAKSSIPAISAEIKWALIKLLIAAAALVGLVFGCLSPIDRGLIGVMASVAALLVLPITISLSIDASRIIKGEMLLNKSTRFLGAVLGIPQAVLGAILVAIGVVYPFFGIRDILADLTSGKVAIVPLITTVTALVMLYIGYYYLREGITFDKDHDLSVGKNNDEQK